MFNNQHLKFLQPLTIGFYGWWHSTQPIGRMDLTWTEGWPGCLRARAGIQEARCEQRTYLKPSEVQELRVQSKPNLQRAESQTQRRRRPQQTCKKSQEASSTKKVQSSWRFWGQNACRQRTKRMIREQGRGRFLNVKRNSERLCSSHLLVNALIIIHKHFIIITGAFT